MVDTIETENDPDLYTYSSVANYGNLIPENEGVWSTVSKDGTQVGLMWSDFEEGMGIAWLSPVEESEDVNYYISSMYTAKVPASTTFSRAKYRFDTLEFGETMSGTLDEVVAALNTTRDQGDSDE